MNVTDNKRMFCMLLLQDTAVRPVRAESEPVCSNTVQSCRC